MSLALATWLVPVARWAWVRGSRRSRFQGFARGGPLAGLALLFVMVAVTATGQAAGLIPEPSQGPAALADAPTAAPTKAAARLLITSHQDGETVLEAMAVIAGTAPANATITRDIAMAQDAHTAADGSGSWSMPVSLGAGANSLTFRIGDDRGTEVTIRITYAKPASTPHPTPTATATAAATTARATATTAPATAAPTRVPVPATQTPGPAATPTLQPTKLPTPTPAPTARSLGQLAQLESVLSAASGYSWEHSPLKDGRDRWMAMTDDQHATCELIGTSEAIQQVDVLFVASDFLGGYHANEMLLAIVGLDHYIDAASWVEDQYSRSSETDRTQTFGGYRLHVMTVYLDARNLLVFLSVVPA
jgi:hypothetical protein